MHWMTHCFHQTFLLSQAGSLSPCVAQVGLLRPPAVLGAVITGVSNTHGLRLLITTVLPIFCVSFFSPKPTN